MPLQRPFPLTLMGGNHLSQLPQTHNLHTVFTIRRQPWIVYPSFESAHPPRRTPAVACSNHSPLARQIMNFWTLELHAISQLVSRCLPLFSSPLSGPGSHGDAVPRPVHLRSWRPVGSHPFSYVLRGKKESKTLKLRSHPMSLSYRNPPVNTLWTWFCILISLKNYGLHSWT